MLKELDVVLNEIVFYEETNVSYWADNIETALAKNIHRLHSVVDGEKLSHVPFSFHFILFGSS